MATQPPTEKEYLSNLRQQLEDPIFDELREAYGSVLKEFWEKATFPKTSSNTVLLVERRCHKNIEFVLQNFMYFTYPRGFSLTIACSRENEGYIRNILGKHAETTHFIIPFEANGEYETAHNEYNTLMQSPEFWEQIQADYILSMQTDCYLRKQLPDILWTVEYAAAPWAWSPVYVGGSGLTWRKKEAVLEMCRIVAKKPIAEDVFFSQRCLMLKKKVLPLEEGEHIFSESRFVDDPVGVHQWWTYLYQTDDESFIERYTKIYMTLDI